MTTNIRRLIGDLHFRADVARVHIMRPFWMAASWSRLKVVRATLLDCEQCGQFATWQYAPAGDDCHLCDKHVPMGCTCHAEDRPCVENLFSPYGWPRARDPRPALSADPLRQSARSRSPDSSVAVTTSPQFEWIIRQLHRRS